MGIPWGAGAKGRVMIHSVGDTESIFTFQYSEKSSSREIYLINCFTQPWGPWVPFPAEHLRTSLRTLFEKWFFKAIMLKRKPKSGFQLLVLIVFVVIQL